MTGQYGRHGGIAKDNRKFINAVVWILKTGFPWRDLLPDYGKRNTVHQRFIQWQRKGISKIHLAINERGLPVKFIVIDGTHVDCKEAVNLLKNLDAKLSFANRAYDTNEIFSYIAKQSIKSVISPKRNRLEQRDYNHKLYSFRYVIENTFLILNVGVALPPDTLKRSMIASLLFISVVSLCICDSCKFFSCKHYLTKILV